jgi:hypothetical protein
MNGISLQQMNFLVYLVELTSTRLFQGDKAQAFKALSDAGMLVFYSETYDTSHTLGSEYLLSEIAERLWEDTHEYNTVSRQHSSNYSGALRF